MNRMTVPRGFSLLEVLITLVIVSIGLLGLGALQARTQLSATESVQRAHAILLAEDMVSRINLDRAEFNSFLTTSDATPLGVGDSQPSDCTTVTDPDPNVQRALRDRCEWSRNLKGASEQIGGASVGAMIGARGCIDLVQPQDASPGVCQPAIIQVATAWQGIYASAAPADGLECGKDEYGDEAMRRVVARRVVLGLPKCL